MAEAGALDDRAEEVAPACREAVDAFGADLPKDAAEDSEDEGPSEAAAWRRARGALALAAALARRPAYARHVGALGDGAFGVLATTRHSHTLSTHLRRSRSPLRASQPARRTPSDGA